MNDARSLPLFAIVAAALAAALWFWPRNGGVVPVATPPMEVEAAAVSAREASPDVALVAPVPDAGETRVPADPAGAVPAFEFDDARPLLGRVVFPDGTPTDERCTVVLEAVPPPAPDEDGLTWMLMSFGNSRPYVVLERHEVDRDGVFRLRRPTNARYLRLSLDADYLHGGEKEYQCGGEDDPDGESLTLEPWLGGHVTFQLVPEPQFAEEARALAGRAARMTWSTPRSGFGFGSPWSATIDTDLQFVVRALAIAELTLDDYHGDADGQLTTAPFRAPQGWSFKPAPGQRQVVEVPLERGHTLAGFVHDESGRAVPGAKLSFRSTYTHRRGSGSTSFHVEADEQGVFQARGIALGLESLHVEANGLKPLILRRSELDAVLADPESVELTLSGGNRLAGVVRLADGRPVEELQLQLAGSNGRRVASAVTDEAGHFAVTGLGEDEYTVTAKGWLRGDETQGPVRLERWVAEDVRTATTSQLSLLAAGLRAGPRDVTLVLVPAPAVRGRVIDDRGAPVEAFKLFAEQKSKRPSRFSRRGLPRMTSDREQTLEAADGRFEWTGFEAGEWEIWADLGDRQRPLQSNVVELDLREASGDVVLVVPRSGSVAGVVTMDSGRPVVGAKVIMHWVTNVMYQRGGEVVTDAVGRFTFESLHPGRYAFEIAAEEAVMEAPFELEITAGEARERVELVAFEGGFLAVQILDLEGQPVAEARPSLRRDGNGRLPSGAHWTTTNEDGRARIGPLPPEDYRISASVEESGGGYRKVSATAEVIAGETREVLLGGVPTVALSVLGTLHSGGAALEDYSLSFSWPDSGYVTVRTDADGTFALDLERGGAVRMNIAVPEGATCDQRSIELPAAGTHTLDLDLPTGEIHGRTSPPLTGMEVFGFVVAPVRGSEGGPRGFVGARLDQEDGTFTVRHVAPGRYTLVGALRIRLGRDDSPQPTGRSKPIDVGDGQIVRDVVLLIERK